MSLDRSRKNGISSWCKECRIVSSRKWVAKQDKEELKRNRKLRHDATFDTMRQRSWMLKYRYGITQDMYNAILQKQNYQCAICKRNSKDMTYFLHTDHDHSTNEVRGLLCSPCNVYLGYVKDNPEIFNNAIQYLKGDTCA